MFQNIMFVTQIYICYFLEFQKEDHTFVMQSSGYRALIVTAADSLKLLIETLPLVCQATLSDHYYYQILSGIGKGDLEMEGTIFSFSLIYFSTWLDTREKAMSKEQIYEQYPTTPQKLHESNKLVCPAAALTLALRTVQSTEQVLTKHFLNE